MFNIIREWKGTNNNSKKPKITRSTKKKGGKKNKNPYIIFCNTKREEVRAANPNLTSKEILSKLVEMWNALDVEQKAAYKPKPRQVPQKKQVKKEEEIVEEKKE
ncbi:hypothetical protein EDI_085770 [Entamoeba dispar SAW760]|uniref:HMG box domain-containing protein n=1 Tax=Entamoeba dispar (strain ATCC PRA-260 / SAW760) TaxID=370354 RepID=B0EF26_ENTDS|nr:uncharacterized protein EDI_085770 [Entamoeba dispar SAW760]EDR26875.1 hypothetical protein EDI_085770 [Entamoeba dispar SAW760]|eukprot:EDR26875.1 hypothetical protein EDI_085770 [Entamoeba dispar SAW760]